MHPSIPTDFGFRQPLTVRLPALIFSIFYLFKENPWVESQIVTGLLLILVFLINFWGTGMDFKPSEMEVTYFNHLAWMPIGSRWMKLPQAQYYSLSHRAFSVFGKNSYLFSHIKRDGFYLYLVGEQEGERYLLRYSEDYQDCYRIGKRLADRDGVDLIYQYGVYNEPATDVPPFS